MVQHNVGGPAQNGLFSGVPEEIGAANSLTTLGNVVRFNGARGVSVVNAGTATLVADVVTDNYRVGLRVESTLPGVQPVATVRGASFACNHAPGICLSSGGLVCRVHAECPLMACAPSTGSGVAATGAGVFLDVCADDGCLEPSVDLGPGGTDVGRNALTANANPGAPPPSGINLGTQLLATIPAAGNQWEHCDPPPLDNPNKCNVEQVELLDVRDIVAGPGPVDLGSPIGPRHGPVPVVTSVSPARPRAGELVRVYGGSFNAIDGAACHPTGLPTDPCSADNPAVVATNAGSPSQGNQVAVVIGGERFVADVHQVTPSMLVFEMPVDCFAAATLEVARGNDEALPVGFCDPGGCVGRQSGALCDDDDVCTLDETCDGNGACVAATVLSCTGSCLTGACDAGTGCVPKSAVTACDDGSACTVGDHCDGVGDTCVAGSPVVCAGQCLTGGCDDMSGCVPRAVTTACNDDDACTEGDRCAGVGNACVGTPRSCDDGEGCTIDGCDAAQGCVHEAVDDGTGCVGTDPCRGAASCQAGVCTAGAPLSCDDGDACTSDECDPVVGCRNTAKDGLEGVTCHVAQLEGLVAGLPDTQAKLAARLARRIACVAAGIDEASARTEGSRGRRRWARRAQRCAQRFVRRVLRAEGLTATTKAQLRREGDTTSAAIALHFGLS